MFAYARFRQILSRCHAMAARCQYGGSADSDGNTHPVAAHPTSYASFCRQERVASAARSGEAADATPRRAPYDKSHIRGERVPDIVLFRLMSSEEVRMFAIAHDYNCEE